MNIRRIITDSRMSQVVVHRGVAYLSGQVDLNDPAPDAAQQTRRILARIDALLARVDSSKERLLNATIWLSDMHDFASMNAVWQEWLPDACAPARATVQAQLALPGLRVEIAVHAAVVEVEVSSR